MQSASCQWHTCDMLASFQGSQWVGRTRWTWDPNINAYPEIAYKLSARNTAVDAINSMNLVPTLESWSTRACAPTQPLTPPLRSRKSKRSSQNDNDRSSSKSLPGRVPRGSGAAGEVLSWHFRGRLTGAHPENVP